MKFFFIILLLYSCKSTETIVRLQGRVVSGKVLGTKWRALNGGIITNPDSLSTTVMLYRIGIYQFELNGGAATDTVQIKVIK